MTRNLADSTIRIFNTRDSADQNSYAPITNPCIGHIDPTSYYPDKESCLETDASKNIVLNQQMDPGS